MIGMTWTDWNQVKRELISIDELIKTINYEGIVKTNPELIR